MEHTQYFGRYGGVAPQYMSTINGFHKDNEELSRNGDLYSIVPTSVYGAVPMESRNFVPSGRPITTELAYAQQQSLAEWGIGLAPGFYREENHQRVLCADYLLETALCYVYSESSREGYLATKGMPIYDTARRHYPLPAPSKTVREVLHTTGEEVASGRLKAARITQESETKWTVAARQCDFRPKADTAIFSAYAVENHVQVMVRGLVGGAFEIRFLDKDGVEQSMTTTLNLNALSRVYHGDMGYASQVQRGSRSKTGFADLILPDLGHSGDLVTVNVLAVTAVKKLA